MSVFYNDIEKFCCDVLRVNIQRGNLPEGTVSEQNIEEISATDIANYRHVHLFAGIGAFPLGLAWAGVDERYRILTGGFPCQDISIAGQQAGITGERSGLWGEMLRIIRENNECAAPFDYILIENVRNLLSGGDWQEETEEVQTQEWQEAAIRTTGPDELDYIAEESLFKAWMGTVLAGLASVGYDAEWCVLRAADVGAPHLRARVFILAYPNSHRQRIRQDQQRHQQERQGTPYLGDDGTQGSVVHTGSSGRQELNTAAIAGNEGLVAWGSHTTGGAGRTQPRLGRMFDGLSHRVDRYQWPALRGEVQREYEPSRVSQHPIPRRRGRLKALGNAIVPQLVAEIGRCIVASDR